MTVLNDEAAAVAPLAPRTTYVAVAARGDGAGPDQSQARRAARSAVEQRLLDAASPAAAAQGPLLGALLLGPWWPALLDARAGTPVVLLAAWSALTLALAAGLALWPRRLKRAQSWLPPGLLAGCASLAVAVPAWWVSPAWQAPLATLAFVWCALAASLLAPLRRARWACLGGVPVAATALARADGASPAPWLLVGAAVAVAIGLAALQRGRGWRRNLHALIEQGDRIRQLERERAEAREADGEKGRFLAIASHDLRQPVHALALFTATLHKRLHGQPEEPLVRNMVRSLDGLERSFNAILDVSRLDASGPAPTLQTFALRDLFRRLHMHFGGQAELAGLGLRLSPGGKSVTSDPQMLERVLGNLIQNAIKYTERGGIVVVARSTATHTNVEVWDTGSGISAEELPRIFNEFYQIGRAERDRAHGLGMGLAIVKRLVRSLGHSLTVSSRPGKGTMFRIGIPLGGLPGIQETMAPADTVPMEFTEPRMVLVIDDEESIREGLRLLLGEWGFQTVSAADSAQAEQCVRALEGRVDLILSDLHLGEGPDGLEAIDNVRRLCRHEVPAILVTGDTAVDEVRRVAASGHLVLFKPLQPRRLFDALRDQLS